jgi:hypothetical protein
MKRNKKLNKGNLLEKLGEENVGYKESILSFYDLLNKAATTRIGAMQKKTKQEQTKPKLKKLICDQCLSRSITTGYCKNHDAKHCVKCSTDTCGEDYWNPSS